MCVLSGQKYVFDIQRTMREAHDHARRVLYSLENDLHASTQHDSSPDDHEEGHPAETPCGGERPSEIGEQLVGAEGGAVEVMDTQEEGSFDDIPEDSHCTSSHCQVKTM